MTITEQLQTLIDFYNKHPHIPKPYINLSMFIDTKGEALLLAKLPGATKSYDDNYLTITVPVGPGMNLEYFIYRNKVCTPTKTTIVEVPARAAYTVEKVVEWDCHPLLQPTPKSEDEGTPF